MRVMHDRRKTGEWGFSVHDAKVTSSPRLARACLLACLLVFGSSSAVGPALSPVFPTPYELPHPRAQRVAGTGRPPRERAAFFPPSLGSPHRTVCSDRNSTYVLHSVHQLFIHSAGERFFRETFIC